jgi:ribosomal protein S18 acetylase RimI-like enzyme
MLIRLARPEDCAAFNRLYLEINDLHAAAHPDIFRCTRQPLRDEMEFLLMLEDSGQAVFIAEQTGEAAGFVNVILRETPPIEILMPRLFAVVDSLGVSQRFQRQGIGRALMQRAAEWAVAKGAASLELTVWDFNQAAIGFYQSLGYEILSRRMSLKLE